MSEQCFPFPSLADPLSLSLSLYAQLAAVDCDTFLVAPFPEFNDAEDAAGSASVLRNVLFCQRVTDTVIDMLHATCYMLLVQMANTLFKRGRDGDRGRGRGEGIKPTLANRMQQLSARERGKGARGAGDPQRLPANATGYNQEHTRTATANGWMS